MAKKTNTIKPNELNPNFLKKIEDKYGPISKDDFFSSNLDTYFKADKPEERGEGGGITHAIIRLPSFVKLFKTLDNARDIAKDLRVLTYKVMLEKFNGKYANLNKGQKEVLKEFMNSIDNTPRLKEIYNTKINEVKKVLKLQARKVKDDATKIKLLEVVNLLKEIDKGSRINNDDLINLLQYYELTEELTKANK